MAYEVGTAYLTILPSARDFASNLGAQLDGPFLSAGQRGGGLLADGVNRGGVAPMGATGKAFGAAFVAGFAAIGASQVVDAVVGWMSEAVSAASDLAETQSKVNQIFGDGSSTLFDYASTADERLGQSQQTFLDGAATLGIFGQSAGLAGDDLVGFSTGMVDLAADLASFNNTSPEDAIEAIGAALRGESEPIRRYGVLLDDATLKARAMEMGIYDGTGSLSQQQRILAAHAEILAQTNTQQGDFARTADGLANTQRTVNAEMENMQAEVGGALMPVVQELMGVFRDEGVPILQEMADWFIANKDEIRRFAIDGTIAGLMIAEVLLAIGEQSLWMSRLWISSLKFMMATFLWAVDTTLGGADSMLGWIPGVGPKIGEARDAFQGFADGAMGALDSVTNGIDTMGGAVAAGRDLVSGLRAAVQELDGSSASASISITASGNGWEFISQGAGLTPYFNTSSGSRRVSSSGNWSFRADGGPVDAGRPYIVGERSWELFVPDRPGTIYNPEQLAAAGVGGGTVNNWNITNAVDARDVAFEVERRTAMTRA